MPKKKRTKLVATPPPPPKLTPTEESDRICAWLGWKRSGNTPYWETPTGIVQAMLFFRTWEGTGILIEQLLKRGFFLEIDLEMDEVGFAMIPHGQVASESWTWAPTVPIAVRAAVLDQIAKAGAK